MNRVSALFRFKVFVGITLVALIMAIFIAVFGYMNLANAGCNNVAMTQNSPVIYNVTFLQNQWIWFADSFLYRFKLDIVSAQLRNVPSDMNPPHPPYEVSIPNQINVYGNHLMPASQPQEITDAFSQSAWRSKLCEYGATRVATPYSLMIFDGGLGTWRYSWGYTYVCGSFYHPNSDYFGAIVLPVQNPAEWTPGSFLHELGHTVGLNHMTVQAKNAVWGAGGHWPPGPPVTPCPPAGSAMDSTQAYYIQSLPCFNHQGVPSGAYYPHVDNPIYSIPTPVPWCP